MKAYIDSSVLLRIVFRSPDPLDAWNEIEFYVSSTLLRLESARALERLRLTRSATAREIADHRAAIESMTNDMDLVAIDPKILDLAAGSFAVPLKALDAIHLGTAMWWRAEYLTNIAFATHDDMLAKAARAAGFEVLGA